MARLERVNQALQKELSRESADNVRKLEAALEECEMKRTAFEQVRR